MAQVTVEVGNWYTCSCGEQSIVIPDRTTTGDDKWIIWSKWRNFHIAHDTTLSDDGWSLGARTVVDGRR